MQDFWETRQSIDIGIINIVVDQGEGLLLLLQL